MAKIEWDLRGMREFRRQLRGGNSMIYRQMLEAIAVTYMNFLHRRYIRASRNPGNPWEPLAESTKKRKRRRAGAILVDTGRLRDSLKPGSPGNLIKVRGKKVIAGYRRTQHSKGITFADLADIHHNGNPSRNLPARPIFVEPDEKTKKRMIAIIKRAINQIGEKSNGRRR